MEKADPADVTDPVTLELVRNRLDAIARQMQVTLLRSATSLIVREGEDGSTGLFNAEGEMISQGMASMLHLAVMGPAIRSVLARFPAASMGPGDVYIVNDPYDGGTHLPDIILIGPIFHDRELVGFSVALAHHEDVGGMAPGSMPADSTEVYQEGLIIPPDWLYRGCEPNNTLFSMLKRNVRLPDVVMGDLSAQLSALKFGVREFSAMLDYFSPSVALAAIDRLLAMAERGMRAEIAKLVDGVYTFEDWIDDHVAGGRRIIRCTMTKRDSNLKFDFAGTDPQFDRPFNINKWGAASAVYTQVRSILAPDLPGNHGPHRPIEIVSPEASLVNPVHPAPIALRAQTAKRIVDVVHGLMVAATRAKIPSPSGGALAVFSFGGHREDGSRFGCSDLLVCGAGARPEKDGLDATTTDIANCQIVPAEAFERHYPIRVLKSELIRDSGGAGQFRGGLGLRREYEILRGPVVTCYRSERHMSDPWGLYGGAPGARHRAFVRRADGSLESVKTRQILELHTGDALIVETGGGGGSGDPLARDPEMVAADVLNGKVSIAAAREAYGVVLADGGTVDRDSTSQVRSAMSTARGEIAWVFDRGADGRHSIGTAA
ncbi:MAG: hydantoinase B/oxoprolinase [Alphaproteobacteria bacterium]|nr:MAG: hydantoinase B/oxoprolinase [Alphaproteobacteria bacterium]